MAAEANITNDEPLDFELLFHACPGHFLIIRPDPPRFTIMGGSQAYFDATNSRREEVLGLAAFDVFPDNPDDPTAQAANQALKSSLEIALETRRPHQLGALKYDIPVHPSQGGGFEERFWTVVNTPILNSRGEVRYLLHQSEDITDFVRLREQRTELLTRAELMEAEVFKRATLLSEANAELGRLNEKLHRNDELKSQFFANVSHELRTPLTLILGPVDRALQEPGRGEADQRLLRSVKNNARLLLKHVNDILEITTLEAGKVEPNFVQVDLATLARQIAGNFESLAEVRGIAYLVHSPEQLPAQVDPSKLQRIVLNLLANAIKFTPEGGTVEFSVCGEGDHATLSVADSGPGIPQGLRGRVFERFFQNEEVATRRFGGTGLGLSIVREFVEMHGGTVEVGESSTGGALFTVRLPLQAPEGASVKILAHPFVEDFEPVELMVGDPPTVTTGFAESTVSQVLPLSPEGAASGETPSDRDRPPLVLVVEDNSEMASYICSSLVGYRTVRASHGAEGLEKAEKHLPDLIVTDIMMPGMSGPQMVEELRRHRQYDRIPILMLSARAEDDLRVKLLRMGAQDYLLKPFSAEELVSRAHNLVKVKRYQERLEKAYRDLKAAQVQLIQSAKMASLGQLVAGIAHEINNPLAYAMNHVASVTEWVKLVSPHVSESLPPDLEKKWRRVEDRLGSAREGIERVKDLVLKLRTFSRLDEGDFKRVEIPESVESVLTFLEHRLKGRITVRREFGSVTSLECFPGGLNQVLMNLVANAIEAIEDEGTITISTWSDESHYFISVRDTGPGLPEEIRERVFDPFFTTKPVGVGTGLGLSISFGIMQSHHGHIRAQNLPEGGCEMLLEIPLDLSPRLQSALS